MSILVASTYLAIFGSAIIVIWFLVISHVHAYTDDPFFAGGKLASSHVRANLAATATSLAGALFFFMSNTALFGSVMLAIPIFNWLGYELFLKTIEGVENSSEDAGSIYRFLSTRYSSKPIAAVSNLIVVFNFAAVFIIEILIGSSIFAYFFEAKAMLIVAAILLTLIAFVYVIRGGFDAVSQTDKWQFLLVVIGFIATGITLMATSPQIAFDLPRIWSEVFANPGLDNEFILAFLVNAFFINLFLPTTQVSSWERFASAPREEAVKGIRDGAIFNMVPVWFLAIFVSAIMIAASGGENVGFDGMFNAVRTAGAVPALLIFPLLFMGLVAALLSTIDSLMISTMLAVSDFRRIDTDVGDISNEAWLKKTKLIMVCTGLALVGISIGITVLATYSENLTTLITQLLFGAYGMPCLLFPVIYHASKKEVGHAFNGKWAITGIILGLVLLWAGSLYGIKTGDFLYTLLAPVAGISIAYAGVKTSHLLTQD